MIGLRWWVDFEGDDD